MYILCKLFFFYTEVYYLVVRIYIRFFATHGIRIYVHWSCHLSRRSPTIFSAAMENRCSSFILSRFSGCILKLILRTMLTTSSGTVVGGVGFLGNRLS